MHLEGKTALVTGGSRGLGRAIAEKLASCGAAVALLYAGNEAAAKETVAALEALGAKAKAYRCDVASHDATAAVVKEVLEAFGGVDILVNNAGIVKDSLILAMGEDDFDSVVDVSLKGTFHLTKHLYKNFMKKRGGRIINITSVVGLMGNAGQANYAAAKAGLIGFTKSTARELAARNVTCNAIAPGFIESDMTKDLSDKAKDGYLGAIPLRRFGKAQEVAELTAFLAGDGAAYITGEVIRVDGGLCI